MAGIPGVLLGVYLAGIANSGVPVFASFVQSFSMPIIITVLLYGVAEEYSLYKGLKSRFPKLE